MPVALIFTKLFGYEQTGTTAYQDINHSSILTCQAG